MACLLVNEQIKEDMIVRIKMHYGTTTEKCQDYKAYGVSCVTFYFIHNEFAKKNLIE